MVDTENRAYWIIDILPKQVPSDSAGRYFTIEKYFRKHLDDLIRKFASILVKLNCYRELQVSQDGGDSWNGDFSPEELEPFLQDTASCPFPLYFRVKPSDALLAFEGDDHYMTLYEPDPELLELVRQLASAEGLFVWTPLSPAPSRLEP